MNTNLDEWYMEFVWYRKVGADRGKHKLRENSYERKNEKNYKSKEEINECKQL